MITAAEGSCGTLTDVDIATAISVSSLLSWGAPCTRKMLNYDAETSTIIVDEHLLMLAIQMMNPHQMPRRLRLNCREQ
jgi:hypothetical protein